MAVGIGSAVNNGFDVGISIDTLEAGVTVNVSRVRRRGVGMEVTEVGRVCVSGGAAVSPPASFRLFEEDGEVAVQLGALSEEGGTVATDRFLLV